MVPRCCLGAKTFKGDVTLASRRFMQQDNWINGDVLKINNHFYNNNKLISTVLTL